MAPYTFVLQVHDDGGAVLLDEQTREYVWMRDLTELSEEVAGRLSADRRDKGGEECSGEE